MKQNYRGFEISLDFADQWSARISRPSTGRTWSNGPRATPEEGQGECLRRARNLVDAFLALKG